VIIPRYPPRSRCGARLRGPCSLFHAGPAARPFRGWWLPRCLRGSGSLQSHHGGQIEDLIGIQVCIPKTWLRQHGGNAKGLWRCVRDVPAKFIRGVVGFSVLSRSRVEKAAGR